MRHTPILATLAVAAVLNAPHAFPGGGGEGDNLVSQMGRLQYFSHKLGLAVSANNKALQGFYVHEVEEVVEELTEIEDFDGIPIGKLVTTILVPQLEKAEQAVKGSDSAAVDAAFDELLSACNSCHQNANRPYLHVERRTDNPYLQSFDPVR